MDSEKSNSSTTYSNINTEEFASQVTSYENNDVLKMMSDANQDVKVHKDAITTFCYEEENIKNEKDAKESRALLPFCIVFGFGSLFSSSVQTYMTSQITVLERTLGLTSSQSGLLLSANDIGFVTTVLIASHFLHRYHIPRILGACILVFGLSGILTSLPHFILQEKMPTQNVSITNSSTQTNNTFLCLERTNNFTGKKNCNAQSSGSTQQHVDTTWVLGYMAAMMVIQGIAKSTRQPLSITYIDNNAKRERTGFYVGILNSFGIFGPMIAITAGGLFNKLPVDLKETTLQPEDPRWIGAWWLGFIVFGACAILLSFPIFCFPAGRKEPREKSGDKRSKETEGTEEISCCYRFGDLPKSVWRVISCPVYTLCLVAVLFQVFGVMSLGSFGPKYIENQFHIPTWKANLIIGPEKLVTTVLGTLCGGILTRKLKLGVTGCLKLAVIARAISLSLNCFNFLFGCDNPPIIGLDKADSMTYNGSCDCSGVSYLPMCADGSTFFSPCHVGCQVETQNGFSHCLRSASGNVVPGRCDPECMYLIPFVIVNALSFLIGTLVIAPSYLIVLRSVPERDRSMAVGLTSFLMALLVFLPAPIVYGKLFDSLCLMWKNNCGEKGACSLYDVAGMRLKFNATDIGLRIGSVLFTLMALLCSGRTHENDSKLNQTKEIKASSATSNSCGLSHVANGGARGNDVSSGYVNVSIVGQDIDKSRKQKPLPPTPDKPPRPSPRPSRDPVLEPR